MEKTQKIQVGSIVEIQGDEMANMIWRKVKDQLLMPYLQMDLKSFDLSLGSRDRTSNKITDEAIETIQKIKLCVKCPTITPTSEHKLKEVWECANNKVRNSIGGTSFTECLELKKVPKLVPGWQKPIILARHCFGDQYKAVEFQPTGGKFELVFEGQSGKVTRLNVFDFKKGGGVAMAFYNTDEEISAFAHSCMKYALYKQLPLYFTTKNTILKRYDGRFKDTFQSIYDKQYKSLFEAKKLWYEHRLIDDMVAYMMKSDGGYVWACKNYDGDVEADCIAQAYGSQAIAVSVQMGSNGVVLTEPLHGTVTRHYREYLSGEQALSNPSGIILAWAKILAYKAKLDNNARLGNFSKALEKAVSETIELGYLTRDLARCVYGTLKPPKDKYCSTDSFISKVGDVLAYALNSSKI